MRTIPRIQRGQSASPANGAGTAARQPNGGPKASSGPPTGGSDHQGELAAAIAKRRAELLAADSSSAAAELPDGEPAFQHPACGKFQLRCYYKERFSLLFSRRSHRRQRACNGHECRRSSSGVKASSSRSTSVDGHHKGVCKWHTPGHDSWSNKTPTRSQTCLHGSIPGTPASSE